MGWIPDVPSIHDYTGGHPDVRPMLAKTRLAPPGLPEEKAPALASKVDLRPYLPAIADQQHLGSCTAHAAAGLVGYFERRALGRSTDVSRLFIYKVTRNLTGATGDAGAYLRTTMEALAVFGAPPEAYWPYDGSPEAGNRRFDVEPTSFCYSFARNFTSLKYIRLDPASARPEKVLLNIRTYLAGGFPSLFGFPAYDEYVHAGPDGKVPFPGPNSQLAGGHANLAVGYDDHMAIGADTGALLVRNSWGAGWGSHGYGWLSYKYVTEALAVDWWTVVKQSWIDTGQFA